jgi:RNA recognition motif-containing protein
MIENFPSKEGSPVADNGFRLFVGNMGSRLTESELRAIVKPCGTVKRIHMVRDTITGMSLGYAFVEMTEGGQAMRAVAQLNGKRIDGHFLIVKPLF